jgi:hypothetical protein
VLVSVAAVMVMVMDVMVVILLLLMLMLLLSAAAMVLLVPSSAGGACRSPLRRSWLPLPSFVRKFRSRAAGEFRLRQGVVACIHNT